MLNGRALVVDDDPLDGDTTAAVLAALGFDAVRADCGAAALALLAAGPVAVLVTDVAMPGMDGPTLLAAARSAGYTGPAVAVTSDPTDAVRTACRTAGAAACLAKPAAEDLGALVTHLFTAGPGAIEADVEWLTPEVQARVLARYAEALRGRLTALRSAAAPSGSGGEEAPEPDPVAVAAAAHALAGPSAMVGHEGLAQLCRSVERAARAGTVRSDLVEAVLAAAERGQATSR
ncbi:response regulator [Pseudonocardia bannensis]|uniref:Response regulator n=1 Tax=Pseudonocardia bannensis TaxID=630973 RepID=A0A848DP83_9PSEU|nr:response regulator [Pseudonocardia bannensis]NMH94650.1 response regulator [Pseudonocardia bannensis]